jgi:peptidoglycan hydrolase-like protein with peptidoglycan-binding domain
VPNILKSVGIGGQNNKADVIIIQRLLNNYVTALNLSTLVTDGGCGDRTVTAIRQFQSVHFGSVSADGRVDPGGRTLYALNATPTMSDAVGLSGAAWWHTNQGRYLNSNALDDLVPDFRDKVKRFIKAMRAGSAQVIVDSTRRNKIRAYLMHFSWRICEDTIAAADVPPEPGCPIRWNHDNAAASKAAAREMRDLFNVAYQPSLRSRHIEGKAIDMTIAWDGIITVRDASGAPVRLGAPNSGDYNATLHRIGASYGVIKLVSDRPHWSTDGH